MASLLLHCTLFTLLVLLLTLPSTAACDKCKQCRHYATAAERCRCCVHHVRGGKRSMGDPLPEYRYSKMDDTPRFGILDALLDRYLREQALQRLEDYKDFETYDDFN